MQIKIFNFSLFFSTDLRNIIDFMYTGCIRTTIKRCRVLRQSALALEVFSLVEAIDYELGVEDNLSRVEGKVYFRSNRKFIFYYLFLYYKEETNFCVIFEHFHYFFNVRILYFIFVRLR